MIQFVVVDGEIKLSDLDDVGNEPQLCHSPKDCLIGNEKYNITLECSRGECQDYNEKRNIYNLHRFYLNLFLLPGAPHHVGPDLEEVEDQAALLNSDSKSLVEGLEAVLTTLRTGKGLRIGKRQPLSFVTASRFQKCALENDTQRSYPSMNT